MHPQGKNVNEQEFAALGAGLLSGSWELPAAQEYKNDLVQPDFLQPWGMPGLPSIPHASSQALVPQPPKPDPNSPADQKQWDKVSKMVAWFTFGL